MVGATFGRARPLKAVTELFDLSRVPFCDQRLCLRGVRRAIVASVFAFAGVAVGERHFAFGSDAA